MENSASTGATTTVRLLTSPKLKTLDEAIFCFVVMWYINHTGMPELGVLNYTGVSRVKIEKVLQILPGYK